MDKPAAIDLDTLVVQSVEPFFEETAWDVLLSLLSIVAGIVKFTPDGSCKILSRNRQLDSEPIVLVDEDVIRMRSLTSGSSRNFSAVEVITGEEGMNMIKYVNHEFNSVFGNERVGRFNISWIGSVDLSNQFARWIVEYSSYPLLEVQFSVPAEIIFSRNPSFGVFDRVRIDFGDGDQFPIKIDEARYSSDIYRSSLSGDYRVFGIEFSVHKDDIMLTLRR